MSGGAVEGERGSQWTDQGPIAARTVGGSGGEAAPRLGEEAGGIHRDGPLSAMAAMIVVQGARRVNHFIPRGVAVTGR
jgi:hypothetical protein